MADLFESAGQALSVTGLIYGACLTLRYGKEGRSAQKAGRAMALLHHLAIARL